MQPDDTISMIGKCLICGAPNSRASNVCTGCLTKGWGRLPNMPLPQPKVKKSAPLYVSDKDKAKSRKARR